MHDIYDSQHGRAGLVTRGGGAGRWGNAKSPAYGTLSDYQFMRRHSGSEKRREKARRRVGRQPQLGRRRGQRVRQVHVRYAPLPAAGTLQKLHLELPCCDKAGAGQV